MRKSQQSSVELLYEWRSIIQVVLWMVFLVVFAVLLEHRSHRQPTWGEMSSTERMNWIIPNLAVGTYTLIVCADALLWLWRRRRVAAAER